MTAGAVLVLLATWVALEAWRGWPGPVRLLRRLWPVKRTHYWVAPGGGRAAVTGRAGVTPELTPARPAVVARLMRSRFGPCDGCGALEDEWCRADCTYLDRMDTR